MIVVIIAGGSGTRLWPLSQSNYPKHLLSLTSQTTLLQNTYTRSKKITDDIYVITEASHADEVKNQLPDLPEEHVIIEPARRGTASCIILGLSIIGKNHDADEPVVFFHADHHITDEEGFAATAITAGEASKKHGLITLIGLQPSYPATGFGYILSSQKVDTVDGMDVLEAVKFVEKPDIETAKKYLEAGNYFWNLGLFAAPLNVFKSEIERSASDLHEGLQALESAKNTDEREKAYLVLKNQPIDTALMEKIERLLVVPGKFDWADIGSFFDLHKLLQGKDTNSLKGDIEVIDCEDSMIHGGEKPIIAIGLSGIVVVDTPEGLLVCAKEKSQLVGDAVKRLQQKQS